MNFSDISLFGAMKSKLGYLYERQGVLAQNVANADTPNYMAKDVQKPDFTQYLSGTHGSLALATTNAKHISAKNSSSSGSRIINRDSTYELNPNGNNVVIEEEMAKIAENQMEYQKTLNLYRKTVDMFKTAIGKTNG